MSTSLALLALLTSTLATAATPPKTLFSPLIPHKILATARAVRPQYPQYTDTTTGTWKWFSPDTWTSGFFPATLYAMNTREHLCGASASAGAGGGKANWADLGRAWSTNLIPLETKTGVGHDVGFLSFPFVEELAV